MEHRKIALDAVGSADRWLDSAKLNAKSGNYDAALYSLEMSVEIALKAVLLSLEIDVPRVHAINDAVTLALQDRRAPKEFKDKVPTVLSTFNALLSLRSVGGYVFETRASLADLKTLYGKYKEEAEGVVKLCGDSVRKITEAGK